MKRLENVPYSFTDSAAALQRLSAQSLSFKTSSFKIKIVVCILISQWRTFLNYTYKRNAPDITGGFPLRAYIPESAALKINNII